MPEKFGYSYVESGAWWDGWRGWRGWRYTGAEKRCTESQRKTLEREVWLYETRLDSRSSVYAPSVGKTLEIWADVIVWGLDVKAKILCFWTHPDLGDAAVFEGPVWNYYATNSDATDWGWVPDPVQRRRFAAPVDDIGAMQ